MSDQFFWLIILYFIIIFLSHNFIQFLFTLFKPLTFGKTKPTAEDSRVFLSWTPLNEWNMLTIFYRLEVREWLTNGKTRKTGILYKISWVVRNWIYLKNIYEKYMLRTLIISFVLLILNLKLSFYFWSLLLHLVPFYSCYILFSANRNCFIKL